MTTNYQEDLVSTPGAGSGDSEAKERAQQVAGTAAEEGQHLAGVAQEHAKKISGEAKDQLRGLVDDATSQIDEQSRTQKSKLAETLRGLGDDLEQMSSQDSDGAGSGPAQQLVQQAAHQAHDLAGRLENREPKELLDDVRQFARRKPGTFILGALAAGIVVGRLTRGAKAARDEDEAPSDVRPTFERGSADVTATGHVVDPVFVDPTPQPPTLGANVTGTPATGGPK
jgi:hypothetical protein